MTTKNHSKPQGTPEARVAQISQERRRETKGMLRIAREYAHKVNDWAEKGGEIPTCPNPEGSPGKYTPHSTEYWLAKLEEMSDAMTLEHAILLALAAETMYSQISEREDADRRAFYNRVLSGWKSILEALDEATKEVQTDERLEGKSQK